MEELNRDFKGVWIPKEIWLDNRLTALEKIILVEIDSLDNEKTGCYASNEYLAHFCQCTETKVSTAISKLKKLDYIEQTEFDGRHRTLKIKSLPLKNLKSDFKKVKSNNIDNNIELLDNKLSNNEKTKTTSFNDINKELKEKQKEQKKAKKIQDTILINTMLDNFTTNEEVKNCLKEYLKVRRKKGLTPEQWKIILEDLRKQCGTDKNYAIEKINKAIAGGWMQIVYIENFKDKPKTSYSSKPTFDNTASHNVPKGIASMNKQEKDNFIENELARDENGNLLKF